MQRSVFVAGFDDAAQRAAERLVGDGGAGLTGPSAYDPAADLPPGAIVIGSIAPADAAWHRAPGVGVTTIAVVADHAAGLAAMRTGIGHYILAADVDGPAVDAVAIAVDRAYRGRRAGFRDGLIDDTHCVGGDAFHWLIQYSADVVHRRDEIGYVILIHLAPDIPTPAEALAKPVCTRLCATTRSADIVSWLGDAWFGVLVSTSLTLDGAHTLVSRLADALHHPIEIDGRAVTVRSNLGMTTFGGNPDSADTILARASAAVDQSAWTRPTQHRECLR